MNTVNVTIISICSAVFKKDVVYSYPGISDQRIWPSPRTMYL